MMASGAPDHIGIISRTLDPVTDITVVNWASASIAGGATATGTLRTVPAGYQESFLKLVIYSNEDEAIHRVQVRRVSDSYVFAEDSFVLKAVIDLSGMTLGAAEALELSITNNHTSSITFKGTLHWISKTV